MYAAAVVLMLLSIALLVIWVAADEYSTSSETIKEQVERTRPLLPEPGSVPSYPVLLSSVDANLFLNITPQCDCYAETLDEVQEIRYNGHMMYVKVVQCTECAEKVRTYFHVIEKRTYKDFQTS